MLHYFRRKLFQITIKTKQKLSQTYFQILVHPNLTFTHSLANLLKDYHCPNVYSMFEQPCEKQTLQ